MPKDEDYTTVLQLLPQTAVESVWLGALLTIHFSGGEVAKEARRLLDGLEALRANTLDASAKPESLSRTAAKGMATFNDVDALQQALIHENKIKILYKDKSGHPTERVVCRSIRSTTGQRARCCAGAKNVKIFGISALTVYSSLWFCRTSRERHAT